MYDYEWASLSSRQINVNKAIFQFSYLMSLDAISSVGKLFGSEYDKNDKMSRMGIQHDG